MKKLFAICFLLVLLTRCTTPEERAKAVEKDAGPKTYTVVIQKMQFYPAEVSVNAGDTVIWINKDFVEHNVTEEASARWSSSALSTGKSWKMVVNESADYFCSIHPVMKGKLTLKP